MTGFGYGKILIGGFLEILDEDMNMYLEDIADVFLHKKGYSKAPFTHIDIEHSFMNKFISESEKGKCEVMYESGILYIEFPKYIFLVYLQDKRLFEYAKELQSFETVYGGKEDGVWIEFPLEYQKLVDNLITEIYGLE